MYKHILVTHDGTAASDKSLKHALHVAKTNNSKVRILHVMKNVGYIPIMNLDRNVQRKIDRELKKLHQEMKPDIENRLVRKAKLFFDEGVSTVIRVKIGHPTTEIVKEVKNNKIDLLIMARRKNLPGIKKLMALGSVTRKVAENISCPVLIINI